MAGKYRTFYLVYNRKSTDEPDNQKNSIKYQRAENERFVEREKLRIAPCTLKGFCMDGVISEKHSAFHENDDMVITVSGQVQYNIDRPKFHQLCRYLNMDLFKGVVFLCYDRASRNKGDDVVRLETFEEIIKEGRKFGVFLTIASQRPSDISPTIISQLRNYFLHRLINNEDIKAVEKTISYLDKVSFEYLPILPTGTCIVAGLLANIPVVIDIGKIEPAKHEPKNKTLKPTENWV